ncbi:universal stress protein [Halalkalicoccus subterraneus]|uniref:universal stress protein n=1 Tax=Halalkalicoccus subterraneus TaxID=2675002 RepID=UPI000EFB904F|nr:universal stress protein [Halalkalicoccus subterraneus]
MDQQILVPFDGSDESETALNRALEENPNAEITVLNVLSSAELAYGGVQGSAAESLTDAQREEAEELFERAQERAAAYDATVQTALEVGTPGEVIVEYAEENASDHIIMGSHGRSGLSRIVVGSVAETVIRNASMTVTIAR